MVPIRRQYLEIKARHPDAILFFRLGDFYETFDADAELVSRELAIALTSKPMGNGLRVPLAGVPVVALEGHLARLVERGHRVAICEQLEDLKASKGLVARGVVRVVSPGTTLEPALLEGGKSNYCAALALLPGGRGRPGLVGVAAVELSTGEFSVCQLEGEGEAAPLAAAANELARLGVAELLLPEGEAAPAALVEALGLERAGGCLGTARPRDRFAPAAAAERLRHHYRLQAVEGLGLGGRPAALAAAGALLDYLAAAQPAAGAAARPLAHLERPRLYEPGRHMQLDAATERALALFAGPGREGEGAEGAPRSLLALLDGCRTAAGRRLLRRRLARPLLELERIEERLERVAALLASPTLRLRLGAALAAVPDLERLLGRVSAGLAAPPEVARLGQGLAAAAALGELLAEGAADEAAAGEGAAALGRMGGELPPCRGAVAAIAELLADEPSAGFEEGGVVRPGRDAELDRLRAQLRRGRAALAALEERERARSGIANLKVGYHRSFGYYLEVSSSNLKRVPPEWERRQTLVNGERFATAELRRYEAEVLSAREGLARRERELFSGLCRRLTEEVAGVRALARGTARLDVSWALAEVAAARGWARPQLDRGGALLIREGRHPLVEAALPPGRFVPNDLQLRAEGAQVLVVTGPNMAGKSTYLRQTALIVLLAQAGSFVPAAEARVGLVDRIFARVGAQDDLTAGQSTFLVEMLETAAILAGATERSLLVLDEIGRGTSTYDGLAIARALLERLVAGAERGPRTLFATHFHELTALAGEHERVANANVAVSEGEAGLRFLYRIVPGGADRSYGIQVAEMAGLPASLLARARELLAELEGAAGQGGAPARAEWAEPRRGEALPDGLTDSVTDIVAAALRRELAALAVEELTPREAIGALFALRERARAGGEGEEGER